MNGLQEALQDGGFKSATDIINEKLGLLAACYPISKESMQIIKFALKRTMTKDAVEDCIFNEIENILKNEAIRELHDVQILQLFRVIIPIPSNKVSVFKLADEFSAEEIEFLQAVGNVHHLLPNLASILTVLLGTVVIGGYEKDSVYISLPFESLKKGGTLKIGVPSGLSKYTPMLIGKKGANVKRMIDFLNEVMSDTLEKPISRAEFFEEGM